MGKSTSLRTTIKSNDVSINPSLPLAAQICRFFSHALYRTFQFFVRGKRGFVEYTRISRRVLL